MPKQKNRIFINYMNAFRNQIRTLVEFYLGFEKPDEEEPEEFDHNNKKLKIKFLYGLAQLYCGEEEVGRFTYRNYEFDKTNKTKYISNFEVFKDHKRNGYATVMLLKFIEWCKKENIENIILEVYIDNKIAISLYEKIGFRVLLYPKSNVIKMIKKI